MKQPIERFPYRDGVWRIQRRDPMHSWWALVAFKVVSQDKIYMNYCAPNGDYEPTSAKPTCWVII